MNIFALEMRLKSVLFSLQFVRRKSQLWPKSLNRLTSKKVLVLHRTVPVTQVHRHLHLDQVRQATIRIATTQIQTVAKKV